MITQIGHTTVELIEGDITELATDAIVNAANGHLAHGGGLAGIISRKGGPAIQRESSQWVQTYGIVPTGSAAITSGGRLNAKHVIHTVGPVYHGVNHPDGLLSDAVQSALQMADMNQLRTVALPAISTGIFGYPMADASEVIIRTIIEYLHGETNLQQVTLCLYGQRAFDIFRAEMEAQIG
ncbi:MAG: macro domain-containing protein [Anaerolineae bacterium]|nr:macro domain-containing protein [Anaerolineae bacterium]